ncbi:TraR/DksA C4-type zinc finger protein [Peribacillus glennii]|uniref:YteA family sporulation protein n=1 Tax=Peribacillus glennii TaxID=2303991 RepID=A0A372LEB5_9BACI|nr:TraR/DksA C4-type zinc finger protein [Peribacillus glennii]RFU63996.1 yteA family sporulation protein [Peribacillus glennii]
MLSDQQISKIKKQLQQSSEDLKSRLHESNDLNLKQSILRDSSFELSAYDNHPGDEGTELFEREKDLALFEHYRNEIRDINEALAAIQVGTYGKCKKCGIDIPAERMEALPTTLYCINHTPAQDTSHNRPVEEGVLMPPFGKFDMDEYDENVVTDAEDTWQEVATFGTSSSPSDFPTPRDHPNDWYEEGEESIGYVEDYENFIGVDIEGKNITIYPKHEQYEEMLDEEGIMTIFGDLPAYEHDPYVEEEE